ncbi:hypothetical protein HYH03_003874 [Edaphochlamys debaryana]|uniref:Uncharacterized protein n=1 Tax=Edaphochlamys debaryana TaxID=47281 RepID=A0A836C2K6_9CHLO|nr:hypothetical protein HYH03_003874 [Edaphochlamys debaryana]|eukprot:KAG2498116.1 hypothetical protein HYH03_003874 [Edaphochlamys debaryana]
MLDARGRFYTDASEEHGHLYGPSIFDCWRRRLYDEGPSGGGAYDTLSLSGAAWAVTAGGGGRAEAERGGAAGSEVRTGEGGRDLERALAAGEAAVREAWGAAAEGFRAELFASRGGVYDWGQGEQALEVQMASWAGPSSSPGTSS